MNARTTTSDSGVAAGPTRLRLALRSNAAFCSVSGALIAALSASLPGILGAGSGRFYLVLGVFLVLYGIQIFFLSRRERIRRFEAILVVAGDVAWVVGSVVVAAVGILTSEGMVLVLATAAAVAGFALWQGRNLPAADGTPR